MPKLKLIKKLSNTTFSNVTIPYKTFSDENKKLIAIATSFHTQWSARDIGKTSKSLLLYNLDSLDLIDFIDNLGYKINDLSFHPNDPIIAIAIGEYDGGAYYEGELLIWNYLTKQVNSIITDNREVTECSFEEDGKQLKFTVNPIDDLDCPDFTDKEYKIDFPVSGKISLQDLIPTRVIEHIDNFNIDSYKNRLLENENKLSIISSEQNKTYVNRNLIWDLKFISKTKIVVARNNATIEVWDIERQSCEDIRLDDNGFCVQLFLLKDKNSLLVNVWNGNFSSNNSNELYSINLSNYEFQKVATCQHTISKNTNNFFLARQTNFLNKQIKDFIIDSEYKIIFEKRLGHYDLFNHYIRIDNNDLLYFLTGNPIEQHQNKTLYSINPISFEIKKVWQLEKQPAHYNDLNGVIVSDYLILNGKAYSSNRSSYGTQELFCVDLKTNKEKWFRKIDSQVSSFEVLDNETILMAMTNGKIELFETKNGKTLEVINRKQNVSFTQPLSITAFENRIAVGLTNGEVEIYER